MIGTGKEMLEGLLHLFYPHYCLGCGTDVIDTHQSICLQCTASLPYTRFHLYRDNPVEKIFWGRLPVEAACSILYFTKNSILQQLLHQLKYKGQQELGLVLGRKMGEQLHQTQRFLHADTLVPLPLFRKREKKRGYNQALLLCEGMGEILQIPVVAGAMQRVSATETQTHKSRVQRWLNMDGRFECTAPEQVKGKHILLVDDVITTGATLEACGQALLLAGAASLNIVTLAYTAP